MDFPIVLASKSQARFDMLTAANVPFTQVVPLIDEEEVKSAAVEQNAKPRDICDLLAQMKAQKVSGKETEAFVIGCDQVLELDGQLLSKPSTLAQARDQLMVMRDRQHSLYSAACIFHQGRAIWRHVGTARLLMRDFSDAYVDEYLARNWPDISHCVGGYKIEGEGIRLFSRVDGDSFVIQGMPMFELLDFLRIRGAIS